MGALRVAEKAGQGILNIFTETVEKLWKSSLFSTCKFGFLLRIWHFAQDFVKVRMSSGKNSYAIDIKIFIRKWRRQECALVSPT
jgi:hypothetical protein